MVRVLTAEEDDPYSEATHPIDTWRHGIMGFVRDYWSVLQPQLKCPAKSGDPRSCFGCLDVKAVTCVVGNDNNERLIASYKPKGTGPT